MGICHDVNYTMEIKKEDYWYENSSGEETFLIKGYGNTHTIILQGGMYSDTPDSTWDILRQFPEVAKGGLIHHCKDYGSIIHTISKAKSEDEEGEKAYEIARAWCIKDLESGEWEKSRDGTLALAKTNQVVEG